MTVSLVLESKLQAVEQVNFSANNPALPNSGVQSLEHNQWNDSHSLNGTTTPDVEKVISTSIALVDGAKTIDLTALTDSLGASYDATGKKLRAYRFRNAAGNAAMIVGEGASNGYAIGDGIVVAPGGWVTVYMNDGAPLVASDAKTLDVSGTGTQSLQVQLAFG